MKRLSYFISARSTSADLLASEVILAMRDQFPKVESLGIMGEWTGRTRSTKFGDLQQCLALGLHDSAEPSPAAQVLLAEIIAQIEAAAPQLAIFVGYSHLHHALAACCKRLSIPVILYEITPTGAIAGFDLKQVGAQIDLAFGINPNGGELVQKSGIAYRFVGSPYKNRADRVLLRASSLGLNCDKPLITLFPGGHLAGFAKVLPYFQQFAQRLSADHEVQVVVSLAEALQDDRTMSWGGMSLLERSRLAGGPGQVRLMFGMNLELLSLSSLAITACGAITVECGILQIPTIAIHSEAAVAGVYQSLLNQTIGRMVIPEVAMEASQDGLYKQALALLKTGQTREMALNELAQAKLSLQGFAAENVVDYIFRELTIWKIRSKDHKTA